MDDHKLISPQRTLPLLPPLLRSPLRRPRSLPRTRRRLRRTTRRKRPLPLLRRTRRLRTSPPRAALSLARGPACSALFWARRRRPRRRRTRRLRRLKSPSLPRPRKRPPLSLPRLLRLLLRVSDHSKIHATTLVTDNVCSCSCP